MSWRTGSQMNIKQAKEYIKNSVNLYEVRGSETAQLPIPQKRLEIFLAGDSGVALI